MAAWRRRLKKAVVVNPAASIVRAFEQRLGRALEPVLILGHMRSGSTLLNHILISHEALIGSGETNRYYESSVDLFLLGFRARRDRQQRNKRPRYAVDQINHDRFTPRPEVLGAHRVRCIFLIREPAGSVSSLLRVLAPLYGFDRDYAVAYYTDRLAGLIRLAGLTDPERTTFLTYEDLLGETRATLAGLTRFLGLEVPLRERYRTFEFTGKRGDPGKKIGLSRISREPVDLKALPAADLARAESAYSRCLARMSRRHRRLCEFDR